MPSLLQATVLFLSFGLLCSAGSCDRTTSSSSSSSSKPTSTVIKSSTIKSSSTSAIKSSSTSAIKSSATSTSRPSSTPTPTPKSSSGSSAASVPAGFKPGVKWQIAIQDPVDIRGGLEPLDAKVMDVDLFLASKDHTLIPGLHVSRTLADWYRGILTGPGPHRLLESPCSVTSTPARFSTPTVTFQRGKAAACSRENLSRTTTRRNTSMSPAALS